MSAAGALAMLVSAALWLSDSPGQAAIEPAARPLAMSEPGALSEGTRDDADGVRRRAAAGKREWAFGGYGGVADTHPSTVEINNGDRTNVTVKDFDWIGKPFKAPIYYGLRAQRWSTGRTGAMLDFTHAKAIAKPDSVATLTGRHNGQDLPASVPITDIFSKLEFSHGHNMVTLNGLLRLVPDWFRVRPYLGAGAGVSLPHTEIGFRADNVRTYEYQFAGFAGQGLAGVEVQLGRASVFLEYKFTYAPYDVPLSHRSPGWLLVTDVWQQVMSWWQGETPPGGRLRTTLATHHVIGGVLVKNGTFVGAR